MHGAIVVPWFVGEGGGGGGGFFKVGRPRPREWKNSGRRWTGGEGS